MKKITSQIVVALVCALLGFLLAYQFRLLNTKEKVTTENYDKSDIVSELEALKKEKELLISKNETLTSDMKKIEQAAANRGDVNQEIKNELDKTRMMLGSEDVKGKGIILYINPKSNILSSKDNTYITKYEVVNLINELFAAQAEAVSINDHRITPQTGITSVSGDKIWIGTNEKISSREPIEIKAIGDQTTLKEALLFPGVMERVLLGSYTYEIKTKEDMTIKKSNQTLLVEFMKSVK